MARSSSNLLNQGPLILLTSSATPMTSGRAARAQCTGARGRGRRTGKPGRPGLPAAFRRGSVQDAGPEGAGLGEWEPVPPASHSSDPQIPALGEQVELGGKVKALREANNGVPGQRAGEGECVPGGAL